MAGFFAKLFKGDEAIDDDFYEEVEETLFMGDMGVTATDELVENLKLNVLFRDVKTKSEAKTHMISKIAEIMQLPEDAYAFEKETSAVLVIGVNGVGKTTTVGKLAKR